MTKLPFSLVLSVDGEPRASSETIARGVEQQHASVIKLIRKHQSDFEAFGLVRFEIRPRRAGQHGGGDVEFALLNEQQSTLLLAFMRNSPRVVEFKIALVREFFRMRDEKQNREMNLWQQMQALIAKEVESKVRATFGSHLMLERKKEIPQFEEERHLLESQIQPSLLLN
jgi:phage regulator Rha-like protein